MPLSPKAQAKFEKDCQIAVNAVAMAGDNQLQAAKDLGIPRVTLQCRLRGAERLGLKPKVPKSKLPKPEPKPKRDLLSEIPRLIRKTPLAAKEIAARLYVRENEVLSAVAALQAGGISLHCLAGKWHIMPPPSGGSTTRPRFQIKSGKNHRGQDHWFRFGVVADNHIGSKYERLDVLSNLYDEFAAEGITTVFNLGNYIEGEARFNKHELLVHGMDAQCRYLAKNYPQRKGITTCAVTGDDHEGWYAQREGVDIGRYVENTFREAGRTDWIDLGYMNAYVDMVNRKSGARAVLEVCHPGGGSAYSDSYAVQKIIEAMESGEKPAIWMGGHYHKMICVEYRNVWAFLCGCTKDLDSFGKKKKLRYVVGGAIIEARQDPDTGAIPRFKADQLRYFNRGYYDGRWSHSGDVTQPEKTLGP